MNMLQSASEWLDDQRREFLSTLVTYVHFDGGTSSESSIAATVGRSLFRAEDEYGVTIRVHSVDFIVSASALVFQPSKGDEILYAGHRYEVLAPNDEPVWRFCGNGNESIRIHSKDMGEVADE